MKTRILRWRNWLSIAALSITVGCASQPSVSPEELEAATASQSKWFVSLAPQQPIEVVLPPVADYQQSSFEVLLDGTLHQYVQGQFPFTNVLFGLYFTDGLLQSLILDQQVGDFGWCRVSSHGKGHWLAAEQPTFASWLLQHNQLAGSFDPDMRHPPQKIERMSGAEMAEAATYLPIIAIALPLYAADRLAGGIQRDARNRRRAEQQSLKAMAFQPGHTTRDEVLRSLGSADEQRTVGRTRIWRYHEPGVRIGMVDGVVMWKESGSPYAPKNSAVVYSRNCKNVLLP